MPKTPRSAVTEKYKKCIGMQKCLKLAVLLSWNYTKNAKSRRSAVMEKCQKVTGPGHGKMLKDVGS